MDGSPLFHSTPLVFAASDEIYFRKHALGFAKSALRAGHPVHITVTPAPGVRLLGRASELKQTLIPEFLAQFSADERLRLKVEVWIDPRAHDEMEEREAVVYYQSLRFFRLPALLRDYNRPIVVLDIDSLVMRPIPHRYDADVGLYLRLDNEKGRSDYERLGMKVLGAMVYADPKGIAFFEAVEEYLSNHTRLYYVDQRALYETFLANREVRIFDIADAGWLDWTFQPDSTVWTAKGKRKRRNLTYVRERLKLEGKSWLASTMTLLGYRLGIIRH